ncbi:hypothetical protein CNEO_690036 [Clostridium neonatale]|nr:hypothetical protein CNEO_690036 [Clostridium neonatale]CAI3204507.1 hypothetical protein CNEO2_410011 [Clostridium neonatale]CAI3553595.1 hypothetical protein CNEO4_110010 [Clostridium neonatale]
MLYSITNYSNNLNIINCIVFQSIINEETIQKSLYTLRPALFLYSLPHLIKIIPSTLLCDNFN